MKRFYLVISRKAFPAAICVLKRIEVWAAVSINRGDLSIKDDIADGKARHVTAEKATRAVLKEVDSIMLSKLRSNFNSSPILLKP